MRDRAETFIWVVFSALIAGYIAFSLQRQANEQADVLNAVVEDVQAQRELVLDVRSKLRKVEDDRCCCQGSGVVR